MPGFGWKFGPRWGCYCAGAGKEPDRDVVEKNAKDLLAKAVKGEEWMDPRGIKHIPLIVNGETIGNLWKDADLKAIEIGAYWSGRFGIKAELVGNKEVIGVIWLSE
jgi:hypothetical protein